MLRLSIGYPSAEVETEILSSHAAGEPLEDLEPITDARGIADMIAYVRDVHVAPALRRYIVDLVEATRHHADMYLGASPRASIMMLRAARGLAAAHDRDYVVPDDVKALVVPALGHRVIVAADAVMAGRDATVILEEVLAQVDVPVSEGP
jgi:MoxR-like ATPase